MERFALNPLAKRRLIISRYEHGAYEQKNESGANKNIKKRVRHGITFAV